MTFEQWIESMCSAVKARPRVSSKHDGTVLIQWKLHDGYVLNRAYVPSCIESQLPPEWEADRIIKAMSAIL